MSPAEEDRAALAEFVAALNACAPCRVCGIPVRRRVGMSQPAACDRHRAVVDQFKQSSAMRHPGTTEPA